MLTIHFHDPGEQAWPEQIQMRCYQLGAPTNQLLFPPHFLQVVLPKIGGRIFSLMQDQVELGMGLLFPRGRSHQQAEYQNIEIEVQNFTLNFYQLQAITATERQRMLGLLEEQLAATIVDYDPPAGHHFEPTHAELGGIDLGRPNRAEAEIARQIQQSVWNAAPGFLYPVDIYSQEFGLGTSLIARVQSESDAGHSKASVVAGFLFGFHKFGGATLPDDWSHRFNGANRIESQAMGVLPEFRGRRIGYLLKLEQARQALKDGIGIINWTADPLQFPNAALNFGLLRAVAFDFYPDLYPFRNELNQVATSRFSLTWLVKSLRVSSLQPFGERAQIINLADHPEVLRIHPEWHEHEELPSTETIAIEIPLDWTGMQRDNVEAAIRWRRNTDRIFEALIGCQPGRYVITGAAIDGDRRYLIGERSRAELWQRLGMTT